MGENGKARARCLRLVALLLLALFVCGSALWSAGCGRSEKKGAEEAVQEEAVQEEAGAGERHEAGGEAPSGEGRAPSEPSETEGEKWSGEGFSTDPQRLGAGGAEPMDLFDMYWSDKVDYVEIVFEFRKRDGSALTMIPNVASSYPSTQVIALTFFDLPTSRCERLVFQRGVPVDMQIPTLDSLMLVDAAEGEPATIQVACTPRGSTRRPHRLTYKAAPMRVVLDIWKR
jgi:hypothetical protein